MASYQVVGKSRLELLNEFLAAVGEEREAKFSAISLDDPSLIPRKVTFVVSVTELHNTKPIFVDVVDAKNPKISFRIPFFQGQEAVCFEIII
jgi:hypothetical protein